ncbi:MAG: cardiolipin synthase [Verrucomicrobiota bacterium]|nr:cardiolipin synthase [Verrucomicrobiota bacterium]
MSDPAFRESIGYLLGPLLEDGNRVKELVNGDQVFPAMLEAARGAKKTITMEMYIWASGKLSDEFIQVFSERARAGVNVKCLVDGVGSIHLKKEDIVKMKAAGVQFVFYGREKWWKFKPNLNHRTHRKIMVVDGTIGFMGGVCIEDKWLGNAESLDVWRDTHFRIEGPAVKQMQAIFAANWLQTTGEVIQGADYFPESKTFGDSLLQCFKSGPSEGKDNARILHLFSIAAARKTIRLSHAYFVPDDLAITVLLAARKRGVEIEVIVPGKNDSAIGRAASRSRWGKLLEAGVKFYAFQPALYHCKEMIVDDLWVTAGSMNFDSRSFHLNDEANFNVLDKNFAAAQIKVFEEDKSKSKPLTLADFNRRPWYNKWGDYCAGFLRSML